MGVIQPKAKSDEALVVPSAACIFCGKPTGSREHTFPACLGGRRWNKGILCAECNGKFSIMDTALDKQLNFFNGSLGIRPDHSNKPKKAIASRSADENQYTLDGAGYAELLVPTVLSDQDIEDKRHMTVRFTSEKQAQDWFRELRKKGTSVQIQRREEYHSLVPDGLNVKFEFGGEDGFREIARIALNFLAHFFPSLARMEALRPFKEYVLGNDKETRTVWYEFIPTESALPVKSFEINHRILIGLDARKRMAYARMSLFGVFELAIRFGEISPTETLTRIVDINPLADHPPGDIKEYLIPGFALAPVGEPQSSIGSMACEEIERRFTEFLERVSERHLDIALSKLLPALNATRIESPSKRKELIFNILEKQRQRIFTVLQHVIEEMIKPNVSHFPESIKDEFLGGFLEEDSGSRLGITPFAESVIDKIRAEMALCASDELDHGDLSRDFVQQLIYGKGAITATLGIIALIFDEAGIFMRNKEG